MMRIKSIALIVMFSTVLYAQTTFHVNSINAPSEAHEAAAEFAADIWGGLLNSSVDIHVEVSWKAINADAETAPATHHSNEPGLPLADTFYPTPLAQALEKIDLATDKNWDIRIQVNNNPGSFSWYPGLDSNPPPGQRDLVTALLHEIGHGIGFTTAMNVEFPVGRYGKAPDLLFPTVYDKLVVDASNNYLTDEAVYVNGSVKLGDALQSPNGLFINSIVTECQNNGNQPRLFLPPEWRTGISYVHLDDASFPGSNPNALMTHHLSTQEVHHDPGPITLGILEDIGWPLVSGTLSASIFIAPGNKSIPVEGKRFKQAINLNNNLSCANQIIYRVVLEKPDGSTEELLPETFRVLPATKNKQIKARIQVQPQDPPGEYILRCFYGASHLGQYEASDTFTKLDDPSAGTAVYFDANQDQYLSTDYAGITGSAPRTIEFRMNTSVQTEQMLVSYGPGYSGTASEVTITVGESSQDRLGARFSRQNIFYNAPNIRDGSWHHVAVVVPAPGSIVADVQFYYDGQLLTDLASSVNDQVTLATLTGNFHMGRNHENGLTNDYTGSLDEIRGWSVARTALEINMYKDRVLTGIETGLDLYLRFEGNFLDSGPFNYSVTEHNGVIFVDPLAAGTAVYKNYASSGNLIVPSRFDLQQNYPNPFNPSTTIRYKTPQTSSVILKIYDILGQEVNTLVNQLQAAGERQAVWDGMDQFGVAVGSGIYIYRIQAGEYVQSRKMLLIR